MRTSVVIFSVSAVALLFAHDGANAQCASDWGVLQLPDGKNSPCFQFNVDSSSKQTGSLPMQNDEIVAGGVLSPNESLFDRFSITGSGNDSDISVDSADVQFSPKSEKPKRPLVRDLFFRSSDHWKSVWLADKRK
jgi:hypothetical protein